MAKRALLKPWVADLRSKKEKSEEMEMVGAVIREELVEVVMVKIGKMKEHCYSIQYNQVVFYGAPSFFFLMVHHASYLE